MRRVFITDIAIRTPIGVTIEEAFTNITNATPAVKEIENIEVEAFPQRAAGEVRKGGEIVKSDRKVSRALLFLEEVTTQLSKEKLLQRGYHPHEVALNVGIGTDYFDLEGYIESKGDELSNLFDNQCRSAERAREIGEQNGIKGGVNLYTAACSSSTQAIGTAYRMVKRGFRKAILAGGSDSMINYINYNGFYKLGALSSSNDPATACKPFDRRRDGTILGEGAALLLLEEGSNISGEQPLAEIVGYGSTIDGYALTDPHPEGLFLAKAIEIALTDAQISPSQIDAFHLHGTGTPKNAVAEYQALLKLFGKEKVESTPAYSMKGQIGHLIAACGAVEMVGALYSLEKQVVPATLNFSESDPEAPLYVIKEGEKSVDIEYLLKVNSSFGGENSALILRRVKPL